jgi:RNA-directed DNA polymerase
MSMSLAGSPEDLRESFYGLRERSDIARALELTTAQLNFHLYVLPDEKKYKCFFVPKRGGGTRVIFAPASPLKIIQRKLKQLLESVYQPKPVTHGFVSDRNIVSNARLHKKRNYVLNIDLEDFFPTIHFGRVRGMFMGKPYLLNDEVATILAQISCYAGALPQGAPTSPIISNMICAQLDSNLKHLANEHQCSYSRYADDITFSTNRSSFPVALAHMSVIGQVELGYELSVAIERNGFKINSAKSRLQPRRQRQEVTGLTVNKYPNIRRRYVKQVRAILHAWRKYGLESTAQRYFENYSGQKYFRFKSHPPAFQKVILGKIQFIGMVKGKNNPVYVELLTNFRRLAPEYVKLDQTGNAAVLSVTKPFLYTEGKTDRKHILAALAHFKAQGLFPNLDFDFPQGDSDEGDSLLVQKLRVVETQPERHTRPHIFVFDRDMPKIIKEVKGYEDFSAWKNSVYSLVIPVPKHREDMEGICIELYYVDDDIVRSDKDGRRLYLSREFNPISGMHAEEYLICKKFDKLKGELKILDELVLDRTGNNVAMSKNNFAENIMNQEDGFTDIDFSGFKPLFERIQLIISDFDGENN